MDTEQKITIIDQLIESLRKELIAKLPKMPETWDGIEIRQLFADKAAETNYRPMTGKRMKDYKNEVNVRNL